MEFSNHFYISDDGAKISYRQTGNGPGLIICHGAGRSSFHFQKLAAALSDRYTVYIPDRRGRGLSDDEGNNYGMKEACEDLTGLLRITNAPFVFGHSAGGLIALETALVHPLKKIALYEPPISLNGSLPSGWVPAFEKAIAKGRKTKAMMIFFRGLQLHEGVSKLPGWALFLLISLLRLMDLKNKKGTRIFDLLSTIPADMKMTIELDSKAERYRTIESDVLLLAGSESQPFFHQGIQILENILPHKSEKKLAGFDHYSPEEKVDEMAVMLNGFFV